MHLIGRDTNFDVNDEGRRNRIAKLLEEFSLVKVTDPKAIENNVAPMNKVKILKFKEKDEWKLISKYSIGNKIKK